MKFLILLCGVFLVACLPAQADITRVSANPAEREVRFRDSAVGLTVSWIITRDRTGGPVDMRSGAGRLRAGDNVVAGTPPRAKTVSGNPDRIHFTESVTLPKSALQSALAETGGRLVYERDFTDDPRKPAAVTGRLVLVVKPDVSAAMPLKEEQTLSPPPPLVANRGVVALTAPAPDTVVEVDTIFKWVAIKGAAAYHLQVMDARGRQAVIIRVTAPQAALSRALLQMQGPAVYKWRVAAADADGNVIALSETRSIRVKAR